MNAAKMCLSSGKNLTRRLVSLYYERRIEMTFFRRRDCVLDRIEAFVGQYLKAYAPYKTYWNYEDGCVLVGCMDLYEATGKPVYRDFVLNYLARFISPDGVITNFPMEKYNIDSINCGKVLFFAYDTTGDERYRKAADFLMDRLSTHPRCSCGNFWHKEIYPEQIWLDGLYMAQPFRMEYDMRFGGKREIKDIVSQFLNVRKYLYDDRKGLYFHACDMARQRRLGKVQLPGGFAEIEVA